MIIFAFLRIAPLQAASAPVRVARALRTSRRRRRQRRRPRAAEETAAPAASRYSRLALRRSSSSRPRPVARDRPCSISAARAALLPRARRRSSYLLTSERPVRVARRVPFLLQEAGPFPWTSAFNVSLAPRPSADPEALPASTCSRSYSRRQLHIRLDALALLPGLRSRGLGDAGLPPANRSDGPRTTDR